MSRAAADSLITKLGSRLGMESLRLDSNGCCQLLFDQRWLITVIYDAATAKLWLCCPFSPPGAADSLEPSQLLSLLRANFMGNGTAGGILSMGPDQRTTLQLNMEVVQADVGMLSNALELLLNRADQWAQWMEQVQTSQSRSMLSNVPWDTPWALGRV